jgi:hypothetical protein
LREPQVQPARTASIASRAWTARTASTGRQARTARTVSRGSCDRPGPRDGPRRTG